jgi:hypothetical protein
MNTRAFPAYFVACWAGGVGRQTPGAGGIDTWLGRLRPLLLTSPAQLRPGEPSALSSARCVRDVNEVKTMGAKTGSGRTAHQTGTALFYIRRSRAP